MVFLVISNSFILFYAQLPFSVFAQKPINSSIFPSNTSIRNIQSDAWNSLTLTQVITGVLTAGSAIFGGFIGTYLTNRSNREIENDRHERQKRKDENVEAKQKELKDKYHERLRLIVFDELHNFSSDMQTLLNENYWRGIREEQVKNQYMSVIEVYKLEFTKLSLSDKLELFNSEVLIDVHIAYNHMDLFLRVFLRTLKDYESGKIKNLKDSILALPIKPTKKKVDDAILKVQDFIPNDIVGSYKTVN